MESSEKPLNLKKALELYDILGKYIPDVPSDKTVLEFVGKIVDKIVEDGSSAYIEAICLMTGYIFEDLQNLAPEERLMLFMDGLMLNNIINLVKFCKDIGYDRWSN